VFDDWFSTFTSDVEFLDDPPPGWCDLFSNSRFQHVFDDETSSDLTGKEWLTPDKLAQKRASEHSQQIRSDQEKRISKNMGSSVEPQRERQPNAGEPPTLRTKLLVPLDALRIFAHGRLFPVFCLLRGSCFPLFVLLRGSRSRGSSSSQLQRRIATVRDGRTGIERVAGETPDILEWLDFDVYDLVWVWDNPNAEVNPRLA
jgi:hypothetical protein